jgi:hypothetical protein
MFLSESLKLDKLLNIYVTWLGLKTALLLALFVKQSLLTCSPRRFLAQKHGMLGALDPPYIKRVALLLKSALGLGDLSE